MIGLVDITQRCLDQIGLFGFIRGDCAVQLLERSPLFFGTATYPFARIVSLIVIISHLWHLLA